MRVCVALLLLRTAFMIAILFCGFPEASQITPPVSIKLAGGLWSDTTIISADGFVRLSEAMASGISADDELQSQFFLISDNSSDLVLALMGIISVPAMMVRIMEIFGLEIIFCKAARDISFTFFSLLDNACMDIELSSMMAVVWYCFMVL